MPAFPKFEDWDAPWDKDGAGEFDADRAKGLLYNSAKRAHEAGEKLAASHSTIETLTNERDEAVTKVKAIEDKDLPEVERLRRENEQLKTSTKADPAAALEVARLRVAIDKGLTTAQAARLVGTTAEELAADADVFLEEFGGGKGTGKTGDDGDDTPPERSTPRRRVNGRLSTGFASADGEDDGETYDPRKLVADLPPSRF